jgi:hypothetical protein
LEVEESREFGDHRVVVAATMGVADRSCPDSTRKSAIPGTPQLMAATTRTFLWGRKK